MADVLVRIGVDDKGNPTIERLRQNATKAEPAFKGLGNTLKKAFAVVGAYKAMAMLTAQIGRATDEAIKFEAATRKIQGITGVAGAELDILSTAAKELSVQTEYSAASIQEAALAITKMGVAPIDTIKILPTALDLATAAGEDLTWTAKNTVNIIKAFRLPMEDVGRVANIMGKALNKTSLDLEDYMEGMKFVAQIAPTLGGSLEEVSAMMGILADRSIKGSIAGTQIKNAFINILKLTPKFSKELKDVNFEGMTLTEMFKLIHDRGIPVADVFTQFNKRAGGAVLVLGEENDALRALQEELKTSGVDISDMADTIRDNMQVQLKRLKNSFDLVAISIFDAVGDSSKDLVRDFADALKDLATYIDTNKDEFQDLGDTVSSVISSTFNGIAVPGFKVLADEVNGLLMGLAEVLNLFESGFSIIPRFADKIVQVAKEASVLTNQMRFLNPLILPLDALLKTIGKMGDKGEIGGSLDSKLKEMEELKKSYDDWLLGGAKRKGSLYDSMLEGQDAFNTKWKTHLNIIEDQADAYTFLRTEIDKTAESVAKAAKEAVLDKLVLKKTPSIDLGSQITKKEPKDKKKKKEKPEEVLQFNTPYQTKRAWEAGEEQKILFDDRKQQEKIFAPKFKLAEPAMSPEMTKKTVTEGVSKASPYIDFTSDMVDDALSLVSLYNDEALAISQERFEEEKSLIEGRYRMESALAGDNAVKKALAEEKYLKAKRKAEEKYEKEAKRIKDKERKAALIQGIFNAHMAALSIFATSAIPSLTARTIMAAAALTFGLAIQAKMASLKYRHGGGYSGGVYGDGNETSDSITAKVSKGEFIVDSDTVSRNGGFDGVEQKLSFGAYNNNNVKTVNIMGPVIGTRQFVRRELIPAIRAEESR